MLLALVELVAQGLPPSTHATVTVRIERPAVATRDDWERAPSASRREMIIRDERGQRIIVRLIEYQ
jgi:hypothetical protein